LRTSCLPQGSNEHTGFKTDVAKILRYSHIFEAKSSGKIGSLSTWTWSSGLSNIRITVKMVKSGRRSRTESGRRTLSLAKIILGAHITPSLCMMTLLIGRCDQARPCRLSKIRITVKIVKSGRRSRTKGGGRTLSLATIELGTHISKVRATKPGERRVTFHK
jgi:hypothetical protein